MGERALKYHGLGNDFVILDRRASGKDISASEARALCHRHHGLGADGILVLLPASTATARMVVHNADGSIAEMCGNGIRCVVKYLADSSGSRPRTLRVETGAGPRECALHYATGGVSEVEVEMGPAMLVAPGLPSEKTGHPFVRTQVDGFAGVLGTAVSMGNPHLVLEDMPLPSAQTLGPALEQAREFPNRTNVEFVRLSGLKLEVVVWERGVGLTQACGTGACAAVAALVHTGKLPAGEFIQTTLPGGSLAIRVSRDLSSVVMRGPATFVYEATLPDPALA
jgi:diaminopimelate epimerase